MNQQNIVDDKVPFTSVEQACFFWKDVYKIAGSPLSFRKRFPLLLLVTKP
jgi:hypothetical protein